MPPREPPRTNPASDPLALYRALRGNCERMLDAARDADWDRLQMLGRESQGIIDRMHRSQAEVDEGARREKFRIIRSIVEIDAQIRHLSQPGARAIDRLMAGAGVTRSRPAH